MPMPLYNLTIGKIIQPPPIRRETSLPAQQENQVENEQHESRARDIQNSTRPVETSINLVNQPRVSSVNEKVELDRLLSGEKGILVDLII